MVKNKILMPAI